MYQPLFKMAKAKLIYDLSDPDDLEDYKVVTKAQDMAFAIWEFVYNTKKDFEWKIEGGEGLSAYDLLDAIYEKFADILNHRSIDIDDLVK